VAGINSLKTTEAHSKSQSNQCQRSTKSQILLGQKFFVTEIDSFLGLTRRKLVEEVRADLVSFQVKKLYIL